MVGGRSSLLRGREWRHPQVRLQASSNTVLLRMLDASGYSAKVSPKPPSRLSLRHVYNIPSREGRHDVTPSKPTPSYSTRAPSRSARSMQSALAKMTPARMNPTGNKRRASFLVAELESALYHRFETAHDGRGLSAFARCNWAGHHRSVSLRHGEVRIHAPETDLQLIQNSTWSNS